MSATKIKFRQGRRGLRIALIVVACVLGVILLTVGVLAGVVWYKLQPKGRISLPGSYTAQAQTEYAVQEYTDYYSGSATQKLSKAGSTESRPAAVYELYNALGRRMEEFCGEWDGETDPETLRAGMLAEFQKKWLYSDSAMEQVSFFLYQPTATYRFTVTGAELTEETISVTLRLRSGEGEPQELTAAGSYQMDGEWGTADFSASELPESVSRFFLSFQYSWYVNNSNCYANVITFSGLILLAQ